MNKFSSIHKDLQHIVGDDGLVPSDHLATYSTDGLVPQAVAIPADIDQLSAVLRLAYAEGMAVLPRSGGTRTHVGNPPARPFISASLEKLSDVVRYQPADLTITVQAGITFDALSQTLSRHSQILPVNAPLPSRSTIGGALASNAAGLLKWQNWNPRDFVIGMKVAQADGTVTKSGGQVVKNVTGYDMARLHIGALGTLGIIVEVSFKLVPAPRSQQTIVFAFAGLDDSIQSALSILQSPFSPAGLAIFNQYAASAVEPQSSLENASYLLAISLTGGPSALKRQLDDVASICLHHNGWHLQLTDSIWQTLVDVPTTSKCVMSTLAALLRSQSRDMLAFLESHIQPQTLQLASICDFQSGAIFSYWLSNGEKDIDLAVLHDSVEKARQKAHSLGGFLNVEKCPTSLKTMIDVWDSPGDSLAVMKRMKQQYDSRNILNPGRFVGGI